MREGARRSWKVREALAFAQRELASAGVAQPAREARRLLALALVEPFPALGPDDPLPRFYLRRFRSLVECRRRGVPFPLLEGRVGFLDFELKVRPGVFVPRPETEELAERAMAVARTLPPQPKALDLGTGTGALAIAMARARPDIKVLAVDRSQKALSCAAWNVRSLGLADRVELRRSSWFFAIEGKFHLIVANPPYIPRKALSKLPREVRNFDPRAALDGGEGGLRAIKHIVAHAPRYLHQGGWLLIEIGDGQGKEVMRFAQEGLGLVETEVERDLAGKERFFLARCR